MEWVTKAVLNNQRVQRELVLLQHYKIAYDIKTFPLKSGCHLIRIHKLSANERAAKRPKYNLEVSK